MFRDYLYKLSFGVLSVMAIVYIIALKYDLFFHLWWLDIIMHFAGGFWVGLTAYWLYNTWDLVRALFKGRSTFFVAVFSALFIGILWEIFEYLTGQTYSVFMPYYLDTAKDLFMDTLGGIICSFVAAKYLIKENAKS